MRASLLVYRLIASYAISVIEGRTPFGDFVMKRAAKANTFWQVHVSSFAAETIQEGTASQPFSKGHNPTQHTIFVHNTKHNICFLDGSVYIPLLSALQ